MRRSHFGNMRDTILVYSYAETGLFAASRTAHADAWIENKSASYSALGVRTPQTLCLYMYKNAAPDFTEPFLYNGRYYLVETAERDEGNDMYVTVRAGYAKYVRVQIARSTVRLSDHNRPFVTETEEAADAFLLDRWIAAAQDTDTYGILARTRVLILPTHLPISVGETVTAEGIKYTVTAVSTASPYRTEAEIRREADIV